MIDSGELSCRSGLSGSGHVFERTTAMISRGGAFCAWMLAGKLKKLKQMRVRKLIADADFMFNRFGRSILKGQTPLKNQED